uniref:F-box domain-containing protein n=1 Tax=Florenciella sp. virus SA2 TaxID=3240092 RepID=A0AB39JDR1_9VIRU
MEYEFPQEVFSYILTFLPRHYRRPLHLNAINKCELFADFTCDKLMNDDSDTELEEYILGEVHGWQSARAAFAFGYNIENGWKNSFMKYKQWREFIKFS